MDQAVQMPSRLLNLLPHIVIAVQVKDVSNEVKGILVVLNVGIESGQVEAVREVVFIDFTEILVASRRDELYKNPLATVAL